MIHNDHRSAVEALVETSDILTVEIVALQAETPHRETRIQIPLKVAEKKSSEVDSGPAPPSICTPPPSCPSPYVVHSG